MRYRDAASFRQALQRRLKERAAGDGARLAWDRERVAFDRLLARLTVVAANRWMLKGGFALDLRMTERARATKDIDLDWRDPEDELLDALLDAVDHDAGDFFAFHAERAGSPGDRLGGSRRFRVSASLAGREFETFPLDRRKTAASCALQDEIRARTGSPAAPLRRTTFERAAERWLKQARHAGRRRHPASDHGRHLPAAASLGDPAHARAVAAAGMHSRSARRVLHRPRGGTGGAVPQDGPHRGVADSARRCAA